MSMPYFWRRRKDLNLRAGYPTYTLSRGASSPLEYFSIRKCGCFVYYQCIISRIFCFVNRFSKYNLGLKLFFCIFNFLILTFIRFYDIIFVGWFLYFNRPSTLGEICRCGGTADALVSGSSVERRVGSNPVTCTKWKGRVPVALPFCFFGADYRVQNPHSEATCTLEFARNLRRGRKFALQYFHRSPLFALCERMFNLSRHLHQVKR